MNQLLRLAWLTALWILLWRELSVANLASGMLVALLVTTLYPLRPLTGEHRLRPVALLTFLAYFARELLVSNLVVARSILTPRLRLRSGIVAVPVGPCSDLVVTIVANAITLTPGTMTLEVSDDRCTLYVHVLHAHDIEVVRQDTLRLLRLAHRAFGYNGTPTEETA